MNLIREMCCLFVVVFSVLLIYSIPSRKDKDKEDWYKWYDENY